MAWIKQLLLTPLEAMIIEYCLQGNSEGLRSFLLMVGRCQVTNKDKEIGVEYEELWRLRDRIQPMVKVGNVTGFDVLKKIYALLIEYDDEPGMPEINLWPEGMALVEVKDDGEGNRESSGDSNAAVA